MKNKIQFLQIISIIIFSLNTYAQVDVNVQNLQYTNNGQSTVSAINCGIIDLASSTNTSIDLGVNLSKPNGQVVGLSTLYVYTQKSSSDSRLQSSSIQIQESFWNHPSSGNDTYSTTPPSFSINSSDFNASGGTLFVVFKSSGGVEYQTICSYTIIKTPSPSFSLTPTSLGVTCGDTSAKTFTVSPANIPSGATVTYQWSYSGWSGTATSSMSSVTLTPSSATTLPSNVSVTPYVNGVAQQTKICTVTRAVFTSIATITGNNILCSNSSVYNINNAGTNTVTWSSSNTSIATISNQTASSVTLTKVGNGSVNLIATLTNTCGQTTTKTKVVNVGGPFLSGLITGPTCVAYGQTVTYTFNGSANYGGTSYQWSVDAPIDDSSSQTSPLNCSWKYLSTQGSNQFSFKTGCIPATAVIRVNVNSSCGNSNYVYLYVDVNASGSCNNRISNIIQNNGNYASFYIDNESKEIIDKVSDNNNSYFASIYDFNGNKIKEFRTNEYNLSDLKSGIYILKLEINNTIITSKIVVK